MARAGAVDSLAVDQDVQVVRLEAAHDDLVRDASLPELPDAGRSGERFADVARGALADLRRLHAVAGRVADDRDGLTDGRDGEREGDFLRLAGREAEGGKRRRRKAGRLRDQDVRAGREASRAKDSALAGGHAQGAGSVGRSHGDDGSGQAGAVHGDDRSGDGRGRGLGERRERTR